MNGSSRPVPGIGGFAGDRPQCSNELSFSDRQPYIQGITTIRIPLADAIMAAFITEKAVRRRIAPEGELRDRSAGSADVR